MLNVAQRITALLSITAFTFGLLLINVSQAQATHGSAWHVVEKLGIHNQWGGFSMPDLPKISSDGRYLAFRISDDNQIYVRDLQTGTQELVSKNASGEPANGNMSSGMIDISGNGRFVAFVTNATNLTSEASGGLFIYDRQQSTTKWVLSDDNIMPNKIAFNKDGRYIAFTTHEPLLQQDQNNLSDVYVFDQLMSTFDLISSGTPNTSSGLPAISDDGNIVAFYSSAPITTRAIYVHTRNLDVTEMVSINNAGEAGDNRSNGISVSGDGRYVAFSSESTNLGPGGVGGFFLRDLANNTTTQIAEGIVPGAQPTTATSEDGAYIAMHLNFDVPYLPEDINGQPDIYVYSRQDSSLTLASVSTTGVLSNGESWDPDITSDGSALVFNSRATNLTPSDVYPYDNPGIVLATRGPADGTAPAVSAPTWEGNPKPVGGTAELTAAATDGESGVAGGEYFIGDEDPGQGNGATMEWDGTNLSATFGTNFPSGVYKINVRAADNAGNWSEAVSDYLVVYDTGFRMTGKRTVVPNLVNGDVLPGLIHETQDDKALFGFNVRYNAQGQIHQNSDFQFSYETGRRCKGPNPENCHKLDMNATSIAWFVTQGTNNSEGTFQGTADLVVDNQTSAAVFKVTGLDGERLDTTSLDHFTLLIYEAGADLDLDEPIYRVSADVDRGNIQIREL